MTPDGQEQFAHIFTIISNFSISYTLKDKETKQEKCPCYFHENNADTL